MRTYQSYLFFVIYLAFICCKKDYYLEDLKQAEKEHTALSNTLIQISVSNNQLLRGNEDLNLKIEDLLSQISKNEMNLSEADFIRDLNKGKLSSILDLFTFRGPLAPL